MGAGNTMKIFVAHQYNNEMHDFRHALEEVKKLFSAVEFQYADVEITSLHILQKIEKMIEGADFSLFDITGWNPNVTLELGIAIGRKLPFVILFKETNSGNDVPSDIKGLDRIQYNSLTVLKGRLTVLIQQRLDLAGSNVSSAYDEILNGALSYIGKAGPVSMSEIAKELKINPSVASSIVNGLKDDKKVMMVGNKKGAKYQLNQV